MCIRKKHYQQNTTTRPAGAWQKLGRIPNHDLCGTELYGSLDYFMMLYKIALTFDSMDEIPK